MTRVYHGNAPLWQRTCGSLSACQALTTSAPNSDTAVNLAAHMSSPDFQQAVPCLLLDLGMGGARVRCTDPLSEGDLAELTLSAPSLWEPLSLPVRVAWVRDELEGRVVMGLHFQPNSGIQLLVLAELLREHDRY